MSGTAPFRNEPTLELRRAGVRGQLPAALEALDQAGPRRFAVQIGDEARSDGEMVSTDPGSPHRVVAVGSSATPAEVDQAVMLASASWQKWSDAGARKRAEALIGAASWLRAHRLEAAALEVRECAKPWAEADADVCEAIDYLEYYARGAIALEAGGVVAQMPGERNTLEYRARGVAAVIGPWNFPIAIPLGMAAGALAVGNAVVLKPAEQSPACGALCVEILRKGGVPADVIALVPGDGAVGAQLVAHRDVATIAFTGSLAVGLEVLRSAATVPAGGRTLKRIVAEFGGKNCVIVDADADLDDAVPGIISSAYSYAGQKCSAASRILVAERISQRFMERLSGAVAALTVGQAGDLATDVPAVIEQEAQERLRRYLLLARSEGRIVAASREVLPAAGWFVAPTVVAELPETSPILSDEIFGPLISVETFSSVDEALGRVDALSYALTGGLYARDPATVEYVSRRSPVGNLYINRPTTGAIVGRQPFGGNRLSGTGAKAGGPDYLMNFVEPHVVTENTLRHGLVV